MNVEATRMLVGLLVLLGFALWSLRGRVVVVRDFEVGLLTRGGRFVRELAPGKHRLLRSRSEVEVVDLRERALVTAMQEVPTMDQVAVKVSAAIGYRVRDARRFVEGATDWTVEVHLAVQLALRAAVGRVEVDELLSSRHSSSAAFREALSGDTERLGIELLRANLRDMAVSGDLKRAFAEAARARAEGKANLERARSESAVLRCQVNAARLLKEHAGLYELRLLEAANLAATSESNTLVLGFGEDFKPSAAR